jgi:hypothetical protein
MIHQKGAVLQGGLSVKGGLKIKDLITQQDLGDFASLVFEARQERGEGGS